MTTDRSPRALALVSRRPYCPAGMPQTAMTEEEQDDEDKHKERAWDDYREANPFGHGNSKLKPCG